MRNSVCPEPFKWKEEYTVNIKVIDDQHKKFLEIINELKIIINSKSCKNEVSNVFFQLAYLIDHLKLLRLLRISLCLRVMVSVGLREG